MDGPPSEAEEAGKELSAILPRLRSYLYLLLGNAHDVEDALQEVSVSFLTRGPGDPAAAQAWLFQACRNQGLNALRGARHRRAREQARTAPNAPGDPATQAERREAADRIGTCLGKLPADLREIVYLKIVEGFSFSELAEALALPRSTVALRAQEGLIFLNRCYHGNP